MATVGVDGPPRPPSERRTSQSSIRSQHSVTGASRKSSRRPSYGSNAGDTGAGGKGGKIGSSSRRSSKASDTNSVTQPTGSIKDLRQYIGATGEVPEGSSNGKQGGKRRDSDGSQTARGRLEQSGSVDGSVALSSSRVASRLSRQESRISAYGPGGSRNTRSRPGTVTGPTPVTTVSTEAMERQRREDESIVAQLRLATENDRALIEQLRGKIEFLQEKLVDHEYHTQAIQRNYEKISILRHSSDQEVSRLKQELQDAQQDAESVRKIMRDMEKNAVTQKQAKEMREANLKLKEEVATLTEKTNVSIQRQRMLEVQNHELERENEVLKGKLRTQRLTFEGKIDELKNNIAQAATRHAAMQEEHDDAHAKAKQIELQRDELESELEMLKQRYAEMDSDRLEAVDKVSSLQEEKKKLAQALQAANQRCQTTLYKMKGEFETRVMQERARIAAGVEDKMQETETLSLTNARLLDEKEAARDALSEMEQEFQLFRRQTSLQQDEAARERDALQRRLDEAQMSMEERARRQHADLQAAIASEKERTQLLQQENQQIREEQRKLYEDKIQALGRKEREMHITIDKLLNAEEALESAFTCLNCFQLFDKAVTCIPCGHSFCGHCADQLKSATETQAWCPECPTTEISHAMPNVMLDNLVGKFVYKKQALQALKEMTQEARARTGASEGKTS